MILVQWFIESSMHRVARIVDSVRLVVAAVRNKSSESHNQNERKKCDLSELINGSTAAWSCPAITIIPSAVAQTGSICQFRCSVAPLIVLACFVLGCSIFKLG